MSLKIPPSVKGDLQSAAIGLGLKSLVDGVVAGGKWAFKMRGRSDKALDDWEEELEEVYLDKGPDGLARFIKRHDEDVEDMDEAWEMVEDFEDDHPRLLRRRERRDEGGDDEERRRPKSRRRRNRDKSNGSSRRATNGPRLTPQA